MAAEAHRRLVRTVTFATALLQGVRASHGALWLRGRRPDTEETALMQAVGALEARLSVASTMLDLAPDGPAAGTLARLAQVDGPALLAAAQALDGLAQRLKPRTLAPRAPGMGGGPGLPGPRTASPVSPPPVAAPVSSLKGLLSRWSAASVETLPQARQAPPAEDPHLLARRTFEAAHTFVGEILAYAGPRLDILRVALEATGLPGPARPLPLIQATLKADAQAAGVPGPQQSFLPPLVRLFLAQPDAVRRVGPAIGQWRGVQALNAEAEVLRLALRTAPPARIGELVGAFETGRYRAAVHPLSHLHITFRGLPVASELFPSPVGV